MVEIADMAVNGRKWLVTAEITGMPVNGCKFQEMAVDGLNSFKWLEMAVNEKK